MGAIFKLVVIVAMWTLALTFIWLKREESDKQSFEDSFEAGLMIAIAILMSIFVLQFNG